MQDPFGMVTLKPNLPEAASLPHFGRIDCRGAVPRDFSWLNAYKELAMQQPA